MKTKLAALLMGVAIFAGCEQKDKQTVTPKPPAAQTDGKPVVVVSNYPLEYFAERIGGDAVTVTYPVSGDVDPAFWEPEKSDLETFQNADLILFNGATYEKWAPTATLPEGRIIDTSQSFGDNYLEIKSVVTHSHGNEGAHSHAGTDFNTWVDPINAIVQAEAVRDGLVQLVPAQKSQMDARFEELKKDLEDVDAKIKEAIGTNADKPIVASHPVYGYLAKRYGLNIVAMTWEPESDPGDAEWEHLAENLKTHPAKFMLWEGDPSDENRDKLKSMGLDSVTFVPAGNTPDERDFVDQMRVNADRLKQIYQ